MVFNRTGGLAGFVVAIALVASTGVAGAQDADGTYQLEPHRDGFVRLNRDTGAVSFCKSGEDRLSCRLGADERAALLDEINDLREQLQALEESVAALSADEEGPPGAVDGGEGGEPEISQTEEMLDEEFERALDFTKRTMRRLFDVVKELQRDLNES